MIEREDILDVKLERLNLLNENGRYLLDVSIIVDMKDYIKRYKSKLILPINERKFAIEEKAPKNISSHLTFLENFYSGTFFDLGFGELECVNDRYEVEIIERKSHEMTISEIEKELGYKVKIVNEKKEE